MENVQAMAVIIGVVNGLRLIKEESKWGFIFFSAAIVCGVIMGIMRMYGLTIESGIVIALASSGLYRVGEKVGGQ